jgi:chemotaxis protein CheD
MNNPLINVGVAQVKTAQSPHVLRTILGSCIGICIFERMKKVGGLAHILLPTDPTGKSNPEKYADTAIPLLVKSLLSQGAKREFLSAKIAGGASMFKFGANLQLGQIGERNIQKVKEILEELKIPIVDEDVGGSNGRVLDFFLEDGRLKIKAAGKEKIMYKV